MNKYLVLTLSVGVRPWFKYTQHLMFKYSQKINCDFKVISENTELNPRNLKCKIYDYLDQYDRIIYFDDSCIISDQTPNLFDIVPEDKLGVFVEPRNQKQTASIFLTGQKIYNLKYNNNDFIFFNSGVMVISKMHKQMFVHTEMKLICGFFDQVYFNCKRHELQYDIFVLDNKFNYMIPLTILNYNKKNVFIFHITRGQKNRLEIIMKLFIHHHTNNFLP